MIQFFFVAFSITAFLYMIILLYISRGIKKLKAKENKILKDFSFSLIIPCRNEETNLHPLFESLRKIDYPNHLYEVIFINDRSEDNTKAVLKNEVSKFNNYHIIDQKELLFENAGKKSALQRGIELAQFEIILTIDADCIVPEKLLLLYNMEYNRGYDIIAGPLFFKDYALKEAFLNIQSLDYLSLIVMAAGAIGEKDPLICSGANFSYKKEAFRNVNGFENLTYVASGDDDLLLHKFKESSYKISYLWNYNGAVRTDAQDSMKKFIQQRIRWGSKGAKYKNSYWKHRLFVIYFFHLFIFCFGIASVFISEYFPLFLASILTKVILDLGLAVKAIKFSRQKQLFFWLLPTLLFQIPYVVIIGFLSNTIKVRWK